MSSAKQLGLSYALKGGATHHCRMTLLSLLDGNTVLLKDERYGNEERTGSTYGDDPLEITFGRVATFLPRWRPQSLRGHQVSRHPSNALHRTWRQRPGNHSEVESHHPAYRRGKHRGQCNLLRPHRPMRPRTPNRRSLVPRAAKIVRSPRIFRPER